MKTTIYCLPTLFVYDQYVRNVPYFNILIVSQMFYACIYACGKLSAFTLHDKKGHSVKKKAFDIFLSKIPFHNIYYFIPNVGL